MAFDQYIQAFHDTWDGLQHFLEVDMLPVVLAVTLSLFGMQLSRRREFHYAVAAASGALIFYSLFVYFATTSVVNSNLLSRSLFLAGFLGPLGVVLQSFTLNNVIGWVWDHRLEPWFQAYILASVLVAVFVVQTYPLSPNACNMLGVSVTTLSWFYLFHCQHPSMLLSLLAAKLTMWYVPPSASYFHDFLMDRFYPAAPAKRFISGPFRSEEDVEESARIRTEIELDKLKAHIIDSGKAHEYFVKLNPKSLHEFQEFLAPEVTFPDLTDDEIEDDSD